jgi:tRNA(fMet)-specific endonuclease VapC
VHLLDTDTLTYLHAGHPRVVQRLHTLDDPHVGITIITKIEILRGRYDSILKAATGPELLRAQDRLSRTESLLSRLLIIPFDEASAAQVDQLRQRRGRRQIGRADV